MTIASRILEQIEGASAVTLYGAYAIVNGRAVHLPQGVQEMESRNRDGRVTAARYLYADDSRLHFTWSRDRGGRYRASLPPVARLMAEA